MDIKDSRQVLYEDKVNRIYWDASMKCVENESLPGQFSGQQFKAILEKVLQAIKEKKATKFLANVKKAENLSLEDLMWTEQNWFPRCLQAGVKYIAVVMPTSLATFVEIDKAFDHIKPDAHVQYERAIFSDVEKAREWLHGR